MICKECEEIIEYCEKCGKPIRRNGNYPFKPWNPDIGKIYCKTGDASCGAEFLSKLMS